MLPSETTAKGTGLAKLAQPVRRSTQCIPPTAPTPHAQRRAIEGARAMSLMSKWARENNLLENNYETASR